MKPNNSYIKPQDLQSQTLHANVNNFQVSIALKQRALQLQCINQEIQKYCQASYNIQTLPLEIKKLFESMEQLYEYFGKIINDRTKFFVTHGGNINFQVLVGNKYKTITLKTLQSDYLQRNESPKKQPENYQNFKRQSQASTFQTSFKIDDSLVRNQLNYLRSQIKQLRYELIKTVEDQRQNFHAQLSDLNSIFKRDQKKLDQKFKSLLDYTKQEILNYIAKRNEPVSFGSYKTLSTLSRPINPFSDITQKSDSSIKNTSHLQQGLKTVQKTTQQVKFQIENEKIKQLELQQQFNIFNKRLEREKTRNHFIFKNLQYIYPMLNAERITASIDFQNQYFHDIFDYDSENKIVYFNKYHGRNFQLSGDQPLPNKGKFYFEVVIEKVHSNSWYIGVVRQKGKKQKSILQLPKASDRGLAIGYCSDGFVLNKGRISEKRMGDDILRRDKVTVMIDRQQQQISWFINNKFQTNVTLGQQFMDEKIFIYLESASMLNQLRILSKQQMYIKNNELQM